MRQTRFSALFIAVSLAAGCASIQPAREPFSDHLDEGARACVQWFDALDRAVEEAGVHDAGAHRIAAFPYLRADRYSASFRPVASRDAPRFEAWAERLRALDLEARKYELSNLPASSVEALHAGERQAAAA